MPSAASHLAAAIDLLQDPALIPRQQLASGEQHGAFLLGTISPDIRAVSGISREATHFYQIPKTDTLSASDALFKSHPSLADASSLPAAHSAFLAGYLAHLIMDETWLELVVMPHIFIDKHEWNSDHPNYRLYSLLMIYDTVQCAGKITPDLIEQLRAARPDNWLPFASDKHIAEWRDRVANLGSADIARQVTRMFARQLHTDTGQLYETVTSTAAIEDEVFSVVPRDVLADYQRATHTRSIETINAYLSQSTP